MILKMVEQNWMIWKKKTLHISNGKGDVNSLFYPLYYATREQKAKNVDNCNEEDL